MILLIEYIIWLFGTIFLHELGHYVAYRMFGIKPKFKLRSWGIEAGGVKDLFRLTPLKMYVIGAFGVVSGLFFTMAFNNDLLFFLYTWMCVIDFSMMFRAFKFRKQYKENMGNLILKELREDISELRRWEK